MKYQINFRDIEKTAVMEKAIDKNLQRLNKYHKIMRNDTIYKIEVRYFYDSKMYRITINANIGEKRHIHATESHKDLFVAIKNSILPIMKQLERFKDLITKSQRNNANEEQETFNEAEHLIDNLED